MEYKTEKTVTYTCTGSWNLENNMLKEESLAFLQKCIQTVENATDEEIEKYRKAYEENIKCDYYYYLCEWNETTEQKDIN